MHMEVCSVLNPATGSEADGRPPVGPITDRALNPSDPAAGGPPAIIEEWAGALDGPGEYILLWAGYWRGRDTIAEHEVGEKPHRHTAFGWTSFHIFQQTPDEPGCVDECPPAPPGDPAVAAKVERLLTPLAHESRIRILQALFDGAQGSTGLSDATGLKGGNLYHHLRELVHAGYVGDRGRDYSLTNLGRQMLLTLSCIADTAVVDRGPEGLAVGET